MRQSSSFDYKIERLTPELEDGFNRVRGGGPGQCAAYVIGCSGNTPKKPCHERVKWHCSYAYVTGRAGRFAHADRHYCDNHARKFCRSHGVDNGPF